MSNEIHVFWNAMQELRTVQIDDDEMDISDDERDYEKRNKRTRYDSDGLKVRLLDYQDENIVLIYFFVLI